jgi:hypothetical protein
MSDKDKKDKEQKPAPPPPPRPPQRKDLNSERIGPKPKK